MQTGSFILTFFKMYSALLVFFFVSLKTTFNMESPIVETKNGKLRGLLKRSIEDYDYCAFLGIPYALPPIGDLRFKDPEPFVEKWSGIREATKYGNICSQFNINEHSTRGSEDCLYLNVYTKSIKNTDKLKPVMFWIHGGAWMFGSGDDKNFGPDYLLRKDIVLVTFNYRLGVFGFLNLEDEIAPGNQGLKDQIMALRWVNENIKNFGGDPNNITIFGESSGGVTVHCIALSPLSKGLFHKAICQSGTIHVTWSHTNNPKKYAYKLCSLLGKNLFNPKEIFEFLRTVDHKNLVKAQEHMRRNHEKTHTVCSFSPGVDIKSSNPAMPLPLEEATLQGVQIKVDPVTFRGFKKEEYTRLDKNPHKIIDDQGLELLEEYDLTVSDLKKLYFGKEKMSLENCGKLADMLGQLYGISGVQKTVKIQVENSQFPTYYYEFTYDGDLTLTKSQLLIPIEGAAHFDEVEYIFNVNLKSKLGFAPLKKNTQGYRVMEQMTEMWTNFATYGSPTVSVSDLLPTKWEPVNDKINLQRLNIGNELKFETAINIEEKWKSWKLEKNKS